MQDCIFQWSDGKHKFADMKDRILALAVNRVSMSRPAPMEVDWVKKTQWWDEDPHHGYSHDEDMCEEAWNPEEETEIGYIRRVVQEVRWGGALRQGVPDAERKRKRR